MGRQWLLCGLCALVLVACGSGSEYEEEEETLPGMGGTGVSGFLLRAPFPPGDKLTPPTVWSAVDSSGSVVFQHTDCPTKGTMMPFYSNNETRAKSNLGKLGERYVTLHATLTQAEDKSKSTFTLNDASEFQRVSNRRQLLQSGKLVLLVVRE